MLTLLSVTGERRLARVYEASVRVYYKYINVRMSAMHASLSSFVTCESIGIHTYIYIYIRASVRV